MCRRARVTELLDGSPPLSPTSPGDCTCATYLLHREAPPNKLEGPGGGTDPQPHFLLTLEPIPPGPLAGTGRPLQAAADGAPGHHKEVSGAEAEARTHTALT